MSIDAKSYFRTPDGRYFVVKGRLWRCTNPALSPGQKARLTKQLMDARRLIAFIKREGREDAELMAARAKVDEAKIALGERGPVWWTDGAPDLNRRLVKNTPYRGWYADVGRGGAGQSLTAFPASRLNLLVLLLFSVLSSGNRGGDRCIQ